MSRSARKWTAVIALAALCGGSLLLRRSDLPREQRNRAEPAWKERELPRAQELREEALVLPTREQVAPPPLANENPSPAPSQRPVFSGHFQFADGSRPPKMSFDVLSESLTEEEWAANQVSSTAPPEGTLRKWSGRATTEDGAFSFDDLIPGNYRIRLSSHTGLGAIPGVFTVPSEGVVVPISGYLIRVRALSDDEQPLSGLVIACEYLQDERRATGGATLRLRSTSDKRGEAIFCLPEPGTCTLRASVGAKISEALAVELRGPSSTSFPTLVLRPGPEASLRIRVSDCAAPSISVTDYCVIGLDEKTHERVFRLCSENADPDGIFRNLPPGRFVAELTPRYGITPAFYLPEIIPRPVPLVLREGMTSDLEFCVRLGGRIAVLVKAADPTIAGELHATVQIESPRANQPVTLDFRKPDARGVTVGGDLLFGESLLSEQVLEPGTYTVIIGSHRFASVRKVVMIDAGRVTPIEVELARTP